VQEKTVNSKSKGFTASNLSAQSAMAQIERGGCSQRSPLAGVKRNMTSEIRSSGLDLGFVIAFVAPGFVAFYALSYHMPMAGEWMNAASKANQGVGVFLFVLLASLAMGLIVSGIRALTIDKFLCFRRLLGLIAVPKVAIDWAQVDSEKLPIILTVRDAFYRHYQFYSNSLVALIFWAFSRATAEEPRLPWGLWVVVVLGLCALLFSARDSLSRYEKAIRQIFERK
jgi:hypothetical protein